jgi:hypothetical protein
MTLVKQGEYRAMYRTTTTRRFRARCPYAKFVRTQRELRQRLGPTGVVDRIRVRFPSAKRAVVAYRFLRNRRPLVWVSFSDRDLYAKVGSRWFDDNDRLAC